MFYTIYKITNQIDGKYYIGKHQTQNLNDGYMGSGKVLKRAIQKHGKENFIKEILHVFETEAEMNAKEKELVVLEESSYNLCPGGKGGWGYVNATGLNNKNHENMGKIFSEKYKGIKKPYMSEIMKKQYALGLRKKGIFYDWTGKHHSEESKQKMSKSSKGSIPWNKGISRTPEEKEKIRQGILKSLKK